MRHHLIQADSGATRHHLDGGNPRRHARASPGAADRGATTPRRYLETASDRRHANSCAVSGADGRGSAIVRVEPSEADQGVKMSDSVYRVTEVIGVSSESWEAAARNAVETAARTVRDLRVAEVIRTDVTIENGTIANYRVRLGLSFKYDSED